MMMTIEIIIIKLRIKLTIVVVNISLILPGSLVALVTNLPIGVKLIWPIESFSICSNTCLRISSVIC